MAWRQPPTRPPGGRRKVNRVLQLVQRARSVSSVRSEDGQTMAEYAVVLGMITAGIVLAVATLSGVVQASFERVNDLIEPLL